VAEESKRILVVDDSEDIREFFRLILENAGYRVITAASGDDGFAKAKAMRPDLIILDVVMPGMDGLQTLLKLRSDLAPPVPPAILCSGFELTEEEALRRGALMFVRKPVAPRDLLIYVAHGLNGQRVGADVEAAAREQSKAARRRAVDAAAELLRRIDSHATVARPTIDAIAVEQIPWLRDYFGFGTMVAAMLKSDRLSVIAAAGDAAPAPGAALGELLPATQEILATGASLVLSDAVKHPCFSGMAKAIDEVRFFAGVPLLAGGVTIGVLCVFDGHARNLPAEDLTLLQRIARSGSALLEMQGLGRPASELPGHFGPGVLDRSVFELLVELELRQLEADGGSMELVIADVAQTRVVSEALAAAPSRARLTGGALGPARVGVFKRDPGDAAPQVMRELVRDLGKRTAMHSVGAVSVSGSGLPALTGVDLVRLAELAFNRAFDLNGGVQRLVLEVETSALGD
jgi:twitching motility two-component system response regulator PilH